MLEIPACTSVALVLFALHALRKDLHHVAAAGAAADSPAIHHQHSRRPDSLDCSAHTLTVGVRTPAEPDSPAVGSAAAAAVALQAVDCLLKA